jgi:hypothetical protein
MSASARTTVEGFLEAFASGDMAAAAGALAPEAQLHGAGAAVRGRASVSFVLTSLKAAFPDLCLKTDVVSADGARIVVRFAARGTQEVALFGLRCGEVREVEGLSCFSVGEAGISDAWFCLDVGRLVRQFALIPAPDGVDRGGRDAERPGFRLGRVRDVASGLGRRVSRLAARLYSRGASTRA